MEGSEGLQKKFIKYGFQGSYPVFPPANSAALTLGYLTLITAHVSVGPGVVPLDDPENGRHLPGVVPGIGGCQRPGWRLLLMQASAEASLPTPGAIARTTSAHGTCDQPRWGSMTAGRTTAASALRNTQSADPGSET